MNSINLEFARAERTPDTPHYKGGYCFDVLRDGVKIAQWRPIHIVRGYELIDLAGRAVRAPHVRSNGERGDIDRAWSWRDVECKSQAEFMAQVIQELDYIPTVAQIAQRQIDEDAKTALELAEAVEAIRIQRIKQAGPALLEALVNLVSSPERVDFRDAARTVIAQATAS